MFLTFPDTFQCEIFGNTVCKQTSPPDPAQPSPSSPLADGSEGCVCMCGEEGWHLTSGDSQKVSHLLSRKTADLSNSTQGGDKGEGDVSIHPVYPTIIWNDLTELMRSQLPEQIHLRCCCASIRHLVLCVPVFLSHYV